MNGGGVHRVARARWGTACGERDPGGQYTTNEAQVSCTACRMTTSPLGWLEIERRGSLQVAESILLDLAPWFGYLAACDGNAAGELPWMVLLRYRRSGRHRAWPLAAAGISAYVRDLFLSDDDAFRASAVALGMRLRTQPVCRASGMPVVNGICSDWPHTMDSTDESPCETSTTDPTIQTPRRHEGHP